MAEHPRVLERAVVGLASGIGDDEVLVAVIVDQPGEFDPAGRLPRFMIPRYVRVLPDFPRNATTGRVGKDELRALVADDRGWDARA